MKRSGFTLLELMIAIFILAMGMGILLGTQSTSQRLMGYANNTSVVTMLTRSKMQDIEYEVQRQIADEGVEEDYSEEMHGDFGEEGYEDIEWEAKIQSIELSDDASNNFVEDVTNQLYGSGDEGGTLSGNTTITQFLPLMVSFMPTIINQLGQRIRKITLTTKWDYLGVEQTLTISQFVVILEVDAASGASGSAVSGSTAADGTEKDLGASDTGTGVPGIHQKVSGKNSGTTLGTGSGSGSGKSGSGGSGGSGRAGSGGGSRK
ncbi:MAG: prepilin-type N-terminal cleavage/methylation domain-containing protein [Proteobacteria bacterium]|nr:prepilin-type N-terminal cleavage/methylation domain-containing protein [Pseudomonadota bacterium]